jgi:hypothetical protein
MRQENKINTIEAGELVLAACECRIGYPGSTKHLRKNKFTYETGHLKTWLDTGIFYAIVLYHEATKTTENKKRTYAPVQARTRKQR